MELLLLPREDLCYCENFLQYKVEFDVSHLQSLVEQLNPDSFFKDECKNFFYYSRNCMKQKQSI